MAKVARFRNLLVALVALLAVGSCANRRKAVEANNRGFALLLQKRYASAVQEFRRGVQLSPKVPELYLGLGRAFEETQRYAEAEKAFRKYVKLRPKDGRGHYYLGLVLVAQKRSREATEAFEQATVHAVPQRRHMAFYRLGLVRAGLDQPNQAAEAFRKAAEANPGFLRTYEELALLYADHGDLGSAEKALLNAVATKIPDAHVHSTLGIVYSQMSDRSRDEAARNDFLAKAAQNFRRATEIRPAYARAYWNLGMTLAKISKSGRPARRKAAVKFLQLFLSRHGKDDGLTAKANDMISHLTR